MKYPFVINENDIEQVDIGWFREEFKNLSEAGFQLKIESILKNNGWEKVEEDDWGAKWKKDFIVTYTTTVYATIGYKPEHMDGCWKYGLQWLEAEYEYDHAKSTGDLEDMKEAMRIAIEHLLAKGIPFHPKSDIAKEKRKNFYCFSNQEIKRNIDLLNATRLLEFNYKALKDLLSEGKENFSMKEWFENFRKDRFTYDGDEDWIIEFIKKEEEENEKV